MKKLLFIFICIISITFSQAQILDWAEKIGGPSSSYNLLSNEVEVDQDGNSYYIGSYGISTFGTLDFDPGPGTSTGSSVSTVRGQAFILKLDPSGNFLWKKLFLGLGSIDGVSGILMTLDSAKNIYFYGSFVGTVDFDPGPGVYTMTSTPTYYDQYFGKLDSLGNLIFVKQFSNSSQMEAGNICLDPVGNIILTGDFTNFCDFDPGPGVFNLVAGIYGKSFMVKTTNLGDFIWAKDLGYSSSVYSY